MTLTPDLRPLTPDKALLIIFAKEPAAGQVKTRLSPPLSPAEAAELYRLFLEDVLDEMTGLPEIELAIAYDPASARDFFTSLAPSGVKLVAQAGACMSDRLIEACTWGFARGHSAVLVRNSDSPDLPGALVWDAREFLLAGRADVVLGPCPDGGYYLVGLKQPCPELFQDVPWSTDAVLEQTLDRAGQLRLKVHLLPRWPDIDEFGELVNFLKRPLAPPAPGWRSHAWARDRLQSYLPENVGIKS